MKALGTSMHFTRTHVDRTVHVGIVTTPTSVDILHETGIRIPMDPASAIRFAEVVKQCAEQVQAVIRDEHFQAMERAAAAKQQAISARRNGSTAVHGAAPDPVGA